MRAAYGGRRATLAKQFPHGANKPWDRLCHPGCPGLAVVVQEPGVGSRGSWPHPPNCPAPAQRPRARRDAPQRRNHTLSPAPPLPPHRFRHPSSFLRRIALRVPHHGRLFRFAALALVARKRETSPNHSPRLPALVRFAEWRSGHPKPWLCPAIPGAPSTYSARPKGHKVHPRRRDAGSARLGRRGGADTTPGRCLG